jgi:hypothetical protein
VGAVKLRARLGVSKPGWHDLQVRLQSGKGEVRTRRGYESR